MILEALNFFKLLSRISKIFNYIKLLPYKIFFDPHATPFKMAFTYFQKIYIHQKKLKTFSIKWIYNNHTSAKLVFKKPYILNAQTFIKFKIWKIKFL
jgi:hypothetical protein